MQDNQTAPRKYRQRCSVGVILRVSFCYSFWKRRLCGTYR